MKYRVVCQWQVVTAQELINTFPSEGEARRHCAALNAAASGGIVQPYPRGRWSTPEPSKTVDIPPQQMIEPEDFRD
jgi:hypothetical protein